MLRTVGLWYHTHLRASLPTYRWASNYQDAARRNVCFPAALSVVTADEIDRELENDDREQNTEGSPLLGSLGMRPTTLPVLNIPAGRPACGVDLASLFMKVYTDVQLADFDLTDDAAVSGMLDRLKSSRSSEDVALREALVCRGALKRLVQDIAHSRRPILLLRLLKVAHELRPPLKSGVHEGAAFHLSHAKHWSLIPGVVELAKQQCRLTLRLLNWLAAAAVQMQNYTSLDQILPAFASEEIIPDRRTFHLLIRGSLRNRDLAKAKFHMQIMERAGFPINASTHAVISSAHRSLGFSDAIANEGLQALRTADSGTATVIVNNLMKAASERGRSRELLSLLAFFQEHKTLFPYWMQPEDTSLRVTGSKIFPYSIPLVPVGSFQRLDIHPDVATFQILMEYWVESHNCREALRLAEQMTAVNVHPDEGTAAVIIRAYFDLGDIQSALRVAAAICDPQGICASQWTALGLSSRTELPLPISAISAQRTQPIFNSLLRGVLRSNGLTATSDVLVLMRRLGGFPDETTVNILVSHLHKRTAITPRQLLEFLRRLLADEGIQPTVVHSDVLLSNILRMEKHQTFSNGWNSLTHAIRLRKTSQTRTSTFDAKLFDPTAGIEIASVRTFRRLHTPLLKALRHRGVRSSGYTFANRLRLEAHIKLQVSVAWEIFHFMVQRGVQPVASHYLALMQSQANVGDVSGATVTMDLAYKAGIPCSPVFYTILINGWARRRRPDDATMAFSRMLTAGVNPDGAAVDALAGAYYAVGAYGISKRVLLTLWTFVAPSPPPEEVAALPLKQLVKRLRKLRPDNTAREVGVSKVSGARLRATLRGIIAEWRHWKTTRGGSKYPKYGPRSLVLDRRVA